MYFGGGIWVSGKSPIPTFTTTFLSKIGDYFRRLAMSKVCSKCKKEKPFSEFSETPKAKSGYSSHCFQCRREYSAKFRVTPTGFYSQVKGRNKFYNDHPFTISREDFVGWYNSQEKKCAYCDCPEDISILFFRQYRSQGKRLSIDCKDNDLGYVKENLALACYFCNSLKSNFFSYEEMRKIGQELIKPKWQKWVKENGIVCGEKRNEM